jgi:replicative DNA helicase
VADAVTADAPVTGIDHSRVTAGTDVLAQAERSVIGQILADPACARLACEHIMPRDFRDRRLGQVYGLVVGMVASGAPADQLTVCAEIERRRVAAGGRGPAWPTTDQVQGLAADVTDKAVAEHARIVRDAAVRRATLAIANRMTAAAHTAPDAAGIASQAIVELNALREDTAGTVAGPKTLGEVLAVPDVAEWVIRDLLEVGDRVILTGTEGAGKTEMLRQVAVMAAAGLHPFTAEAIDPVRVLFVDAENSERAWRRRSGRLTAKAQQWGSADPAETVHLLCRGRMDLTADRDLGLVHKLLDEYDPQVLVIGPLYKLVPHAIQTDDQAAPLITALDGLRDRGVCLLMEAHAGHSQVRPGKRDMRPRGSSALMGWPEFGLGLSLDPKVEGLAHLERWRGDRYLAGWPDHVRRSSEWPWVPASDMQQARGQGAFLERSAGRDE